MLRSIQQRDLDRNRWVKITMSVLLGIICLSMLTYLIPGLGSASFNNNPDVVFNLTPSALKAVHDARSLLDASALEVENNRKRLPSAAVSVASCEPTEVAPIHHGPAATSIRPGAGSRPVCATAGDAC